MEKEHAVLFFHRGICGRGGAWRDRDAARRRARGVGVLSAAAGQLCGHVHRGGRGDHGSGKYMKNQYEYKNSDICPALLVC